MGPWLGVPGAWHQARLLRDCPRWRRHRLQPQRQGPGRLPDELRTYHPLSFAAGGTERNFLLEPLQSLQDEFYTVYFNLVTATADS
jgi:hypothetical protein